MYFRGMKLLALVWLFCPLFIGAQIRVTYLSDPPIEGNEPCISMNAEDPSDIWLAFNNNQVFHTLNRGNQWNPISVKPTQGFYGDPVIYKAKNGMVYLAHLAKNEEKPYPESFDCIVFERSTNGVEFYSKGIGKNGKMQDKPWFTVDEGIKSPYRNNIYLVWTEFDKYGSESPRDSSRIRFSYSENLGATFSEPVYISDVSGDAKDGSQTAEGATVGVFPNGTLICVWSRNDTLWYDKSSDAGRNWGKDVFLGTMKGGWNINDVQGLTRANGMPFLCSDEKGGMYVVYAAKSVQGDWDIWYQVASSSTSGFGKAMRVDDDRSGANQLFPYVTLDRNTGFPRAIWYDMRHSQSGRFFQVYTSELKPLGASVNVNMSPEPIALAGKDRFYGDYISFATAKSGGGMAAVTAFDDRTNKIVIQLMEWKGKNIKPAKQQPVLMINPCDDMDSVLFLVNMPGETSFTFEIKSGPKVYAQQIYTADGEKGFGESEFQEIFIHKNRLPSGVYNVIIRRNKKAIRKRYWVE